MLRPSTLGPRPSRPHGDTLGGASGVPAIARPSPARAAQRAAVPGNHRPGYTLIAVLIVVVVLSLAAYQFTDSMTSEYRVAVRTAEACKDCEATGAAPGTSPTTCVSLVGPSIVISRPFASIASPRGRTKITGGMRWPGSCVSVTTPSVTVGATPSWIDFGS